MAALLYLMVVAGAPIATVFFLWMGISNLMVPARFSAFPNDLYTPVSGEPLFVIVASGASSIASSVGTSAAESAVE